MSTVLVIQAESARGTWSCSGGNASKEFTSSCEINVDALWLAHLRLSSFFPWVYYDCPELWEYLWICLNQTAFCEGLSLQIAHLVSPLSNGF